MEGKRTDFIGNGIAGISPILHDIASKCSSTGTTQTMMIVTTGATTSNYCTSNDRSLLAHQQIATDYTAIHCKGVRVLNADTTSTSDSRPVLPQAVKRTMTPLNETPSAKLEHSSVGLMDTLQWLDCEEDCTQYVMLVRNMATVLAASRHLYGGTDYLFPLDHCTGEVGGAIQWVPPLSLAAEVIFDLVSIFPTQWQAFVAVSH